MTSGRLVGRIDYAMDLNAELQVLDAAFTSETLDEFNAVFESGIMTEDFSSEDTAWVWSVFRQSFYGADWEKLPCSFLEGVLAATKRQDCDNWKQRYLARLIDQYKRCPPWERKEHDDVFKFMVGSRHWWGTWTPEFGSPGCGTHGVPVAEEVAKYRQRIQCKRKLRGLQRIATSMLERTMNESTTADGMELFMGEQLERFREALD